MKEIVEQISICARKSKYVDHQSGVSARFSIANYRTMVASAATGPCASARTRPCRASATWGICTPPSLGKLELDMMGSQQMSEKQVLDAILAEAIRIVFEEYVEKNGLEEIAQVFGKGVKIEVGDMLPQQPLRRAPAVASRGMGEGVRGESGESDAVRASCVEFVLAGLYATDRISRSQKHGRITYEVR